MSATPAPTHALSEFQAGVTAALRSWSALRTAVEGEWGGIESKAKAEDLRASVFSLFDGSSDKPKISLEELEDNLFDYMETEFSIVLEDGSERQVAKRKKEDPKHSLGKKTMYGTAHAIRK